MPTAQDTKRIERRYAPACKKYNQALKAFEKAPDFTVGETYFEFKPGKATVECTTYFHYQSEKYRFDYEIELEREYRLPWVSEIREMMWLSLKEYKTGLWEPTLKKLYGDTVRPAHQAIV